MDIKLKAADITAAKRGASGRPVAKPRYKNGHLPFENPMQDLQTWRNAIVPDIVDWAGTLKKPFAANSHPNLQNVVEDSWNEEFPEIPAYDAVQAV
ncbi:hypothetical protein BDZ97DRAFT_1838008, partial [Flammula alnicola]